jgi:hypothetical protein
MQGVPLGAPFMIYRARLLRRPSQMGPGHERRRNLFKALSTAKNAKPTKGREGFERFAWPPVLRSYLPVFNFSGHRATELR